MRLLCVYQHAPTPGAPGIYRHRTLLAELVRRGWHVDLVSSPINYMRGEAAEPYRGRVYTREVIDGIVHHWVGATGNVHRSFRHRAANYVTFAASATARAATLPRPDVVWASSPPLSVGTVGRTLSRRFRRPWVFEVRDLWPESAASAGLLDERSRAYRMLDRRARLYARDAAAVIVPTPGLVDLVRGHGAREVHTVTGAVRSVAPEAEVRRREREALGVPPDACLFAYTGAHGVVNGLDVLLDAVEQLVRDHPEAAGKVRVVTAGDGSAFAGLTRRLAAHPLEPLQMLGPVDPDRVRSLLAAADVGLHVLRPDPVFESALPTKALEYLGAHRPFITTVPGLPRTVALESGGGYAASAGELAAELLRWAQMPPAERHERGEQAARYGEREYGLAATVDRLEAVLRGVRGARGR